MRLSHLVVEFEPQAPLLNTALAHRLGQAGIRHVGFSRRHRRERMRDQNDVGVVLRPTDAVGDHTATAANVEGFRAVVDLLPFGASHLDVSSAPERQTLAPDATHATTHVIFCGMADGVDTEGMAFAEALWPPVEQCAARRDRL